MKKHKNNSKFGQLTKRIYDFDEGDFGQGASLEEIEQAQKKLGVIFPKSYFSFLRGFGWGGIGSWELFGLGLDVPNHLDLIRITVDERKEIWSNINKDLIPIMNNGAGDFYCLNTKQMREEECPVVFWDHESYADQEPDEVAADFLSWICEKLDES